MKLSILTALLMSAFALTAQAGEAQVREALQSLAPGVKIHAITKAPMAGMYQAEVDGGRGPTVLYVSENGEHLLMGEVIEVKSRRNLTQERLDSLTAIKWDALPLDQAVKVVRGNGARKLAVFSDPDCPYCKKAEQEFVKLDNVTIYTFMYPLQMHPDAPRKSKLVWCSKDRGQAWLDLMLKGKTPAGKDNCDNPVDENLKLGERLRIDGTPAIILANGKRIPGYVPAGRLDDMLDNVEKNGKPSGK